MDPWAGFDGPKVWDEGKIPAAWPGSGLAQKTRWSSKLNGPGTEQEKYPPPSRAPKANNLDTVPKVIVIIICDVQIQRGKPKRNN